MRWLPIPAPRLLLIATCPVALWQAACTFDETSRWVGEPPSPTTSSCEPGELRCRTALQRCEPSDDGPKWVTIENCRKAGLLCAPELLACALCRPNQVTCDGFDVVRCNDQGSAFEVQETCQGGGVACRMGACLNLCVAAGDERSNVGCEYWAVDLDNANVGDGLNAAAQQFAVVVSNPQPDVGAKVTVQRDDTLPGEAGHPIEVASATLAPFGLRVFKLGPREVDGSPPGEFNTGTHTAFTRGAYRITSDVPIIAYQFNPLENVNVFSNDASLLKPTEALRIQPGTLRRSYVVLGWPQTIASTDDPDTNFNSRDPTDLRAFATIVGTHEATRIRFQSSTRVLGDGPRAATRTLWAGDGLPALLPGDSFDMTIDAFDVVNLETDDFGGDFTGSIVEADQPIAVFSGSEASDAPLFDKLSERFCCADHLEEQLDPVRTAGRRFVATVSANRTRAVAQAGASVGIVDQMETFRVVATTPAGAEVTTTLGGRYAAFELPRLGSYFDIESSQHFQLTSSEPVTLGHITPSQEAAGIERGVPGGDPSLIILPPIEQFRSSYVLLTPDKYAFDFIRIIAPFDTVVLVDEQPLENLTGCTTAPDDGLDDATRGAPPEFVVTTCQLSFPVIDNSGSTTTIDSGSQNDGVHRILADRDVGVIVDGFDSYVSYGYAGGTELRQISIR